MGGVNYRARAEVLNAPLPNGKVGSRANSKEELIVSQKEELRERDEVAQQLRRQVELQQKQIDRAAAA
jgi:hypothetical protein